MAYTFMGGRFMSIACHNYAATKIHKCVGTAYRTFSWGRETGISTILIHSPKTTVRINIDLDLETTSNHIMPDNIRRRRAKANAYVVWHSSRARSLCISDRIGNEPSSDRGGRTHEKQFWLSTSTLNREECFIDILFMRATQFKAPRPEFFNTPHLRPETNIMDAHL